jgi:two-component system, chemotaxis family, protein-glutamate methylesterase/glutaminase
MPKIRILIVDDAVVVRRLVSDALSGDPEIEVVGTAANGRIALQKIPQVNPDLVTLDVEMPDMDGLTTLVELRKIYPTLPVIMFSTLTERGAVTTLEALSRGATDYVTKPANVGSVSEGILRVRNELIPKVKGICAARLGPPIAPKPRPDVSASVPLRPPIHVERPSGGASELAAVAIGVSTGGPNALALVIPQLPADLRTPVLIVQHMPPVFTRLLAERLDLQSKLKVVEGQAGMIVRPGHVYLAPGGSHMVVRREGDVVRLALNQLPPENSCRPAVDVLFRSVAEVYGARSLAVVLTGMGADGVRGCEVIKERGGKTLIQDEASSVVWGMPGSVSQAGLADETLPLSKIAAAVAAKVARKVAA